MKPPLLLTVMAALLLTACMRPSEPSKPIYYYTLDYAAPDKSFHRRLPSVLRVNRFSVSPPFNTQRIIYADKGLHRNAYTRHQWIAEPGELLAYFIARDLRRSDGFKAVLTPDASLNVTHILYGWVEEFIELDRPVPWQAAVRVHLTLVAALDPNPATRILFQKTYSATAPCKAKTPSALAQAMSVAVSQISDPIIADIYARIEQHPEPIKY